MSRAVLLPHESSSVVAARHHLCADLRTAGVRESTVEDAALVVSELLSNALRHASPLPPPFPSGSVQLSWSVDTCTADTSREGRIEVAVRDGGADTLPHIANPGWSAVGGRGLDIVRKLAAKWGTEVAERTTTVWALLDLPDPDTLAVADEPVATSLAEGTVRAPESWGPGSSFRETSRA